MQVKQQTPTQKVQRVKAELCDEGPSINFITHNGMATGGAKERVVVEPFIRKATIKKERLNLQKEKETFIESHKYFTKDEASTSKAPTSLRVDDEVKPFVQACMKLLPNQKAVENLQALIDSCAERTNPPIEVKYVHKLYKNKKHIGREMWLTTQIDDYEMDQVILDLGFDVNSCTSRYGKGWENLSWNGILYSCAWLTNKRLYHWGDY